MLKLLEYTSYTLGIALIVYAASTRMGGIQESEQAAQTFQDKLDLPSYPQDAVVDSSNWSEKRIKAWRSTLLDDGPEAFAMLTIPSLDMSVPVFYGASDRNLNAGLGLIEGTDLPGLELGNAGIAGHRDGFFRDLENIQTGETVTLDTADGSMVYRVKQISIVDPSNIDLLLPAENEVVTLVTCYPFYFVGHAPQRFVVQAVRQS